MEKSLKPLWSYWEYFNEKTSLLKCNFENCTHSPNSNRGASFGTCVWVPTIVVKRRRFWLDDCRFFHESRVSNSYESKSRFIHSMFILAVKKRNRSASRQYTNEGPVAAKRLFYLFLLHIMCGYQCDKAVNENDTREVIWYHITSRVWIVQSNRL